MAMTHPEQATHWQPEMTKIIDGQAVRFRDVCVHEIRMGDVEDPDLWIADPIWKWQQSDAGKFVMEHAVEKPYWTRHMDFNSYGHLYRVIARLSEQNELFWTLKWGGIKK
jgi:hypothetical protein